MRRCGFCWVRGHDRRRCPKLDSARKCSRCRKPGHNRLTCPQAAPAPSSTTPPAGPAQTLHSLRVYRLGRGREFYFALPADFSVSDVGRIHDHLIDLALPGQEEAPTNSAHH